MIFVIRIIGKDIVDTRKTYFSASTNIIPIIVFFLPLNVYPDKIEIKRYRENKNVEIGQTIERSLVSVVVLKSYKKDKSEGNSFFLLSKHSICCESQVPTVRKQ